MNNFSNKIVRFTAVIMAFVMITVLTGCAPSSGQDDKTSAREVSYTLTVKNIGGTALDKCKVEVFKDATCKECVYFGLTNEDGAVSFSALESDGYVAVVSKQPNGYAVETHYALEGKDTSIVLKPGIMTDNDLDTVKYSLGDAVLDFTVSAPDGTKYVLSELLEKKKAVVLNFWAFNCGPCKMEFPYLQEAYEALGEDLAVLALNPTDGDDARVAAFQSDNGYTFTMAKCDSRWTKMMNAEAVPMTVVIDRFGNICLIHSGMAANTQEFLNMFGYFVSDHYEQKFFESADKVPTDLT